MQKYKLNHPLGGSRIELDPSSPAPQESTNTFLNNKKKIEYLMLLAEALGGWREWKTVYYFAPVLPIARCAAVFT